MNNDFMTWLNDVIIFTFNRGYSFDWISLKHNPETLDTLIFLFEDDVEAFDAAEFITT